MVAKIWPFVRAYFAGAGLMLFVNAFTPFFMAPNSTFDPGPERVMFLLGGGAALAGLLMARRIKHASPQSQAQSASGGN
jgi:peptidoglycan/LPS O-acetylase OafA/YrhL